MKDKKIITKIFALTALVFGLMVVNNFGQTRTEPSGEATLFGMQTMNAEQRMRLSAVNRQPLSDREIVPCVRVRIIVDFYAATCDGSVCRAPVRRAERNLTLEPGEAVSFDLPASRRGGERVSISVFMSPVEEPGAFNTRGTATATLEVFESERKLFNIPGTIKGFDPQPDPPR